MWWYDQKPLTGPDSTRWYFQVWHGSIDGECCQRLFFWDEAKSETGLMEFRGSESLHFSRIKPRFSKIAKNPAYRQRFIRRLEFSLERYW
jgi:hypothetical protein